MGDTHDILATQQGDYILHEIRLGNEAFKQVFSGDISRVGDWDWPRPDYVCLDGNLNATYALEYKPPYQTKREYLTGLGQAIVYLQKHTYSGLIVPQIADDGFHIADYICDSLSSPDLKDIPISLFAYEPPDKNAILLHAISSVREGNVVAGNIGAKTFWCWWRDMSQYELYDLLNLSFYYAEASGDIYSDYIYPRFYELMISGRTRQWDGSARTKTRSEKSFRAEKQNYKIPLNQLELWSSSEGRLTDRGFELLSIGKKYRPDSSKFLNKLAYYVLVNGRHLDLIRIIGKLQKSTDVPDKSSEYTVLLGNFLEDNGFIGKRKPTERTTGAKISYMRDEMKIWNKLGLLDTNGRDRYFFPGEGYRFNWDRITDLLIHEQ